MTTHVNICFVLLYFIFYILYNFTITLQKQSSIPLKNRCDFQSWNINKHQMMLTSSRASSLLSNCDPIQCSNDVPLNSSSISAKNQTIIGVNSNNFDLSITQQSPSRIPQDLERIGKHQSTIRSNHFTQSFSQPKEFQQSLIKSPQKQITDHTNSQNHHFFTQFHEQSGFIILEQEKIKDCMKVSEEYTSPQFERAELKISSLIKSEQQEVYFERRARKNTCLKKKTLTMRDFSQTQLQEEEPISQIKSLKKVVFIGNEHSQKNRNQIQSFPSNHKSEKENKPIKRGESITSICISSKSIKRIASIIKSSKTLHDLGNNNLIYRLRGGRNTPEKAYQQIQVFSTEQQLRQCEIFAIIKNYPHPNVMKFYEISKFTQQDKRYLIQTMNFFPKNLEQYLIDQQQANTSRKQRDFQRKMVLFQILKGLNFLHRNKITHRNLHPHSVLLNNNHEAVISNFSSIFTSKMHAKSVFTCNWLIRPPEIILQPSNQHTSSGDIWQFGCLIVYMLRQKLPFEEHSDPNLIIEMIKCIGKITSQDKSAIGFKNYKKFIFPSFRRESMTKTFQCEDHDLKQMLKKIFVFNPLKRPLASDLLKSPYFDQLRQSLKSNSQHRYNLIPLFSFSSNQLSQQQALQITPLKLT